MGKLGKTMAVRLKAAIKKQGWSVNEAALQMGLSREWLYKVLAGDSLPGSERLRDLANGLGVTSDYLLGLDPENGFTGVKLTEFQAELLDQFKQIAKKRRADAKALWLLTVLVRHYPQAAADRVCDFADMLVLASAGTRGRKVPSISSALPKLHATVNLQ